MALHNLLARRQADARAWVLVFLQPREHFEDPREMLRRNTDTSVTDGKKPILSLSSRPKCERALSLHSR